MSYYPPMMPLYMMPPGNINTISNDNDNGDNIIQLPSYVVEQNRKQNNNTFTQKNIKQKKKNKNKKKVLNDRLDNANANIVTLAENYATNEKERGAILENSTTNHYNTANNTANNNNLYYVCYVPSKDSGSPMEYGNGMYTPTLSSTVYNNQSFSPINTPYSVSNNNNGDNVTAPLYNPCYYSLGGSDVLPNNSSSSSSIRSNSRSCSEISSQTINICNNNNLPDNNNHNTNSNNNNSNNNSNNSNNNNSNNNNSNSNNNNNSNSNNNIKSNNNNNNINNDSNSNSNNPINQPLLYPPIPSIPYPLVPSLTFPNSHQPQQPITKMIRIDYIPMGKTWKDIKYFIGGVIHHTQILQVTILPESQQPNPKKSLSCTVLFQSEKVVPTIILKLNGAKWGSNTLLAYPIAHYDTNLTIFNNNNNNKIRSKDNNGGNDNLTPIPNTLHEPATATVLPTQYIPHFMPQMIPYQDLSQPYFITTNNDNHMEDQKSFSNTAPNYDEKDTNSSPNSNYFKPIISPIQQQQMYFVPFGRGEEIGTGALPPPLIRDSSGLVLPGFLPHTNVGSNGNASSMHQPNYIYFGPNGPSFIPPSLPPPPFLAPISPQQQHQPSALQVSSISSNSNSNGNGANDLSMFPNSTNIKNNKIVAKHKNKRKKSDGETDKNGITIRPTNGMESATNSTFVNYPVATVPFSPLTDLTSPPVPLPSSESSESSYSYSSAAAIAALNYNSMFGLSVPSQQQQHPLIFGNFNGDNGTGKNSNIINNTNNNNNNTYTEFTPLYGLLQEFSEASFRKQMSERKMYYQLKLTNFPRNVRIRWTNLKDFIKTQVLRDYYEAKIKERQNLQHHRFHDEDHKMNNKANVIDNTRTSNDKNSALKFSNFKNDFYVGVYQEVRGPDDAVCDIFGDGEDLDGKEESCTIISSNGSRDSISSGSSSSSSSGGSSGNNSALVENEIIYKAILGFINEEMMDVCKKNLSKFDFILPGCHLLYEQLMPVELHDVSGSRYADNEKVR
ncbi:uncharacterized protein SCDLUD_000344 [Saccharomycodes ludwigii]|uniref:uncharacterized protein n=1 Tax=Saccharomycodes ludwigii TaxID=36035 RepID=UPI001E838CC8|nr:hypothetical protein SCDLUD_000344 [Saccharomycodes ludwigii]KAH3902755.1 hypothetical protein SCDLUD_000344 [Saccharomycodes ludwigii]